MFLGYLVNNPFKESFYKKRKKNNYSNILIVFLIFYKNSVKIFLK